MLCSVWVAYPGKEQVDMQKPIRSKIRISLATLGVDSVTEILTGDYRCRKTKKK